MPQFLLRNFAVRTERGRHRIWQQADGRPSVEISVRDAAVERLFYGEEAAGLEGRLSEVEGMQALLVRDLRSGEEPMARRREVAQLTWSLAVRTRALRRDFGAAIRAGIEILQGVSDKVLLDAVMCTARREMEARIEEVRKNSHASEEGTLAEISRRLDLALKLLPAELARLLPDMRRYMEGIQFPAAVLANAHNDGLHQLLRSLETSSVVEAFETFQWSVRDGAAERLVLGDCVAVGWISGGEPAHLLRGINELGTVAVPLSPSEALIGVREERFQLSSRELNLASAQVSSSAYFYQAESDSTKELRERLAVDSPLISTDDLRGIVARALEDL